MLQPCPPVSNTERQRAFRERNPGYYGRLHAKNRALIAARIAEEQATQALPAPARTPLQLPAPPPAVELPILITLPTTPQPEPVVRDAQPSTPHAQQLPLFG